MKSKSAITSLVVFAGCLVCALLLALPGVADQPEETPAVVVAEAPAETPADLPETTPAPEERIWAPLPGPCTISHNCPNMSKTISCSGQNYCAKGFIYIGSTRYIKVECDGYVEHCVPIIE